MAQPGHSLESPLYALLHAIKNKFNTKDRGAPNSAGPVATATCGDMLPCFARKSRLDT